MSEKMMAASNSNLRIGCKVISHANSGVWQIVKKSCFSLTCLNSGKYRPACRMTQTGTLSTSSPRAALKMRSFFNVGKLAYSKKISNFQKLVWVSPYHDFVFIRKARATGKVSDVDLRAPVTSP